MVGWCFSTHKTILNYKLLSSICHACSSRGLEWPGDLDAALLDTLLCAKCLAGSGQAIWKRHCWTRCCVPGAWPGVARRSGSSTAGHTVVCQVPGREWPSGLLTACEQDQDGTSWSCSQAVWHIPLLCVQWKTTDDEQRNCPKHVEFFFPKINLRN